MGMVNLRGEITLVDDERAAAVAEQVHIQLLRCHTPPEARYSFLDQTLCCKRDPKIGIRVEMGLPCVADLDGTDRILPNSLSAFMERGVQEESTSPAARMAAAEALRSKYLHACATVSGTLFAAQGDGWPLLMRMQVQICAAGSGAWSGRR